MRPRKIKTSLKRISKPIVVYSNTLEYASHYQFPPFVNDIYTKPIFIVLCFKLKTHTVTYTGPNKLARAWVSDCTGVGYHIIYFVKMF